MSGLAILVIDDDAVVGTIVAAHLELAGHRVSRVLDGAAALAALDAARFDVVVTDLSMPGIDGHELVRRVRTSQPMVRVIAMTGYVSMEQILACLAEGAFAFVAKPLGDMHELDAAIALGGEVLAHWRRQMLALTRMRGGGASA